MEFVICIHALYICDLLVIDVLTDQLDLSLIGWVLLLLSRSLDSVRLSNSDEVERCTSKEREGSVKLCAVCHVDQEIM